MQPWLIDAYKVLVFIGIALADSNVHAVFSEQEYARPVHWQPMGHGFPAIENVFR